MSNSGWVLTVGGVLLVGGGVGTIVYLRARRDKARATAAEYSGPGGAGPAVAAAPSMSLGDAIAFLGGKALTEGAKYAVLGPAAYGAGVAAKTQKAA